MAGLPDDIRAERIKKLFTDTLDDLEHVPLVGDRGTYVHMLSNDCGLGIKWAPKDQTRGEMYDLSELFETETEELKFVRNLATPEVLEHQLMLDSSRSKTSLQISSRTSTSTKTIGTQSPSLLLEL